MHPFEDLVVPDSSVGIHWFGQSSFGLKTPDGTIIQADPYFPHDRPADKFIRDRPPLDETTLRTDFVVLTHNHGDHTCIESIDRIHRAHPRARFVGPSESVQAMAQAKIPTELVSSVTAGDAKSIGPVTLHAVWAKPPEGVPQDKIKPPDVQHLGFVFDTGGVRIYLSGDPINTFADHEPLLKPIRDLAPDIGLLTNHPTEGEFPFFEGSAAMATSLGLKTAVPAHYDCFVQRTYDPQQWAKQLPPGGPWPLVIAYNQSVVYRR